MASAVVCDGLFHTIYALNHKIQTLHYGKEIE